ncbi:MAG: LPS export ABC transporter permease LptG [Immundisolibacterales bacterium]|nr:LPS export ABC transporter permease LptG [Immundisolibacterales bacterium]
MILDRYIARRVLAGVLVVFAGLLALFFVGDLITDLDDVGRGDYDYAAALGFVLMRAPGRMVALLPAATLIGGLLGLGALAHGSELVAMRAAGTSVARLVRAAMQAGAIVVVAGFAIGEWLAPPAERAAYEWRESALRGRIGAGAESGSRTGLWGRDGERYVHLGEVLASGWVRDIRAFRFDPQGRLLSAWRARGASPLPSPDTPPSGEASASGSTAAAALPSPGNPQGRHWRLEEVEISRFREGAVEPERVRSMRRRLPADADRLDRLAARPEWLSIPEIMAHTRRLRESGLRTARFEASLWSRIAAPFSTAAMLFTALALVLGPLQRTGLGARITVGIGLGIGFHILQKVLSQLGVVYDWFAPLAACAPIAALGLLGWWWLRRGAA